MPKLRKKTRVRNTLLLNRLLERELIDLKTIVKATTLTLLITRASTLNLPTLETLMLKRSKKKVIQSPNLIQMRRVKNILQLNYLLELIESIKMTQRSSKRNQYGGLIHTATVHKITSMSQIGALISNLHTMRLTCLSIIDGHMLTEMLRTLMITTVMIKTQETLSSLTMKHLSP